MRISDWSSDVCSSDLSRLRAHSAIRSVLGVLALAFTSFGAAAAAPVAAVAQLPQDQEVSRTVIELAGWVVAANDSQGYPFAVIRSEEHTSELQSLMRISYAVFCLKKKKNRTSDPVVHESPPTSQL